MSQHAPIECPRNVARTVYCGHMRGGTYKSEFACPTCGKSTWQLLNFLRGYRLVCNGEAFRKVKKDPYGWETPLQGEANG